KSAPSTSRSHSPKRPGPRERNFGAAGSWTCLLMTSWTLLWQCTGRWHMAHEPDHIRRATERAREFANRNGRQEAKRPEPPELKRQSGKEPSRGPGLAIDIFTAADLHSMELPEPKWAVDGILPDGLTLLAGKPKLGKSWLALNLALAVAGGGFALGSIPVERGE